MENTLNNNSMHLEGEIASELEFSHELYSEKFYSFRLKVSRLSEKNDEITITASERLLTDIDFLVGNRISVEGQIRSYNKFSGGRNRLILTAFARNISHEFTSAEDPNRIILEGFICKRPIFRTTPFGREITDLLLAVNRAYNKSDYIPIITWGRNARFAKNFNVGEKIRITGRFQSREYTKTISETEKVTMVAYEVSVAQLQRMDGNGEVSSESESISFMNSESRQLVNNI